MDIPTRPHTSIVWPGSRDTARLEDVPAAVENRRVSAWP